MGIGEGQVTRLCCLCCLATGRPKSHSQQGLGIPVPKDTQPTGTMFHIRINKRTVQKPAAHQLWAGMGSREQGHTQGRPKGEAIAQSGEQRRAWVRARVCILPAGGGSFSAAVG